METTVNQRIKFLIDNHFNGNKRAFSTSAGVSATVIENIVGTRQGKPSYDVIEKMYANANVNIEWLLSGNGDMMRDTFVLHQPDSTYFTKADKKTSIQTIPLYDVPAAATLTSVFAGKQNIIDHLSIPNLPKCDGALTVTGDSMYPLVKSGDIVAYKQQPVEFESIIFGEMYLLSYIDHGESYIMIKYIQKSEKGSEYVKLVSQNQHHQSRDISLKKVKALALVKATVRIHSMY